MALKFLDTIATIIIRSLPFGTIFNWNKIDRMVNID